MYKSKRWPAIIFSFIQNVIGHVKARAQRQDQRDAMIVKTAGPTAKMKAVSVITCGWLFAVFREFMLRRFSVQLSLWEHGLLVPFLRKWVTRM